MLVFEAIPFFAQRVGRFAIVKSKALTRFNNARGTTAASVAFLSLSAVFAISQLLHNLGSEWIGEIQAATTIVLVVATSIYAYLTSQTVQLLKDPPAVRRGAQMAGVNTLRDIVHQSIADIREHRSLFPFQATAAGTVALLPYIETLNAVDGRLNHHFARCPPEIALECLATAAKINEIARVSIQVAEAISIELEESRGEKRAWSEMKACFVFEKANDSPTWRNALAGLSSPDNVVSILDKLAISCVQWLFK